LIDSGDTLNYVTQKAGEYQPLSVKTIVLFEKDMKRPYAIQPDYVGKKIPNV
jgi:hypoxanthine-guanine phosphoribosyltransferase